MSNLNKQSKVLYDWLCLTQWKYLHISFKITWDSSRDFFTIFFPLNENLYLQKSFVCTFYFHYVALLQSVGYCKWKWTSFTKYLSGCRALLQPVICIFPLFVKIGCSFFRVPGLIFFNIIFKHYIFHNYKPLPPL